MTDRDPAKESIFEYKDRVAKLHIRNGLRLVLQGIEELWRLPRSFKTKQEQGRR